MVELLPEIEVVADDPFNSHPSDPSLMGPDAREAHQAGRPLQTSRVDTPLVRSMYRRLTAQQLADGLVT